MAQTGIEFAIIALSVVAAAHLTPRIAGYLNNRSTRWTAIGLLAFCVGGFLGDMELMSDSTMFKLVYTGLLVIGVLSPLVSTNPAPARAISIPPVVWALLLCIWLTAVNIDRNYTVLGDTTLLVRLAPSFVWIALLVVRGRSPLDRRMLSTMATFAFAVSGALLPLADDPWRACDETKCGVFGGMLTGLYGSENFMGLQAAMVVSLHFVAFGFKRSAYLVPLGALWLFATESRTSQYAVATSFGVMLLLGLGRLLVKSHSARADGAAKRLFLAFVPTAFAALAMHLVTTSHRADFSGRGWVWMNVVQVLRGKEIAGVGVDSWQIYQQTGLLPSNLYAHSIYVLLVFSGGLIALAMFLMFIWQATVAALRQDGTLVPGLVLGASVLVLGLLEVVWNPAGIDGMAWIPLALVVTSGRRDHAGDGNGVARWEESEIERPGARGLST